MTKSQIEYQLKWIWHHTCQLCELYEKMGRLNESGGSIEEILEIIKAQQVIVENINKRFNILKEGGDDQRKKS